MTLSITGGPAHRAVLPVSLNQRAALSMNRYQIRAGKRLKK